MSAVVNRLLYRSLLRASGRGSRPEVFDWAHFRGDTAQLAHPLTPVPGPAEVVHRLRSHFEAPQVGQIEPFAALRHASAYAAALWPPPSNLPSSLPAFVLPGHTLLVGESARFTLFEPRYIELMRVATEESGGYFVHLPLRSDQLRHEAQRSAVGTLVSVVTHDRLPDGRYVTQVLAGPRVEVSSEREETITAAMGQLAAPSPLLHVEFALRPDEPPESAEQGEQDAAIAQRCIELLVSIDQREGGADDLGHTPPFLSPERLSFFLLGMLLPNDDLQRRLAVLYSTSTTERLDVCWAALAKLAAATGTVPGKATGKARKGRDAAPGQGQSGADFGVPSCME